MEQLESSRELRINDRGVGWTSNTRNVIIRILFNIRRNNLVNINKLINRIILINIIKLQYYLNNFVVVNTTC